MASADITGMREIQSPANPVPVLDAVFRRIKIWGYGLLFICIALIIAVLVHHFRFEDELGMGFNIPCLMIGVVAFIAAVVFIHPETNEFVRMQWILHYGKAYEQITKDPEGSDKSHIERVNRHFRHQGGESETEWGELTTETQPDAPTAPLRVPYTSRPVWRKIFVRAPSFPFFKRVVAPVRTDRNDETLQITGPSSTETSFRSRTQPESEATIFTLDVPSTSTAHQIPLLPENISETPPIAGPSSTETSFRSRTQPEPEATIFTLDVPSTSTAHQFPLLPENISETSPIAGPSSTETSFRSRTRRQAKPEPEATIFTLDVPSTAHQFPLLPANTSETPPIAGPSSTQTSVRTRTRCDTEPYLSVRDAVPNLSRSAPEIVPSSTTEGEIPGQIVETTRAVIHAEKEKFCVDSD